MTKNVLLSIALALGCTAGAHAGEVYTGLGTHGVTLGYAQPVSPSLTLRGDFATLGSHSKTKREQDIDYDARLKYSRTGVFADWFVAGGWRLTGGVTVNNARLDMTARGNGSTIDIGGTTYAYSANDRFDVQVKFPRTTPFLGFGYGHHATDSGFGFTFDLGASLGKAKLTSAASGPSFDAMTPSQRQQLQADIDEELSDLRDDVGKVKFLPLLSIGVNYRF
jgi:hypothetical protein